MIQYIQQIKIHSSVVVIVSVVADDDVASSVFSLGSTFTVDTDSFSDVPILMVAFVIGISDDGDNVEFVVDSSFFGPFVIGFGTDLRVTLLGLPKCIIDIR